MDSYNLAEAKANLSELVDRAAAGEAIEISKRGRPMVRMIPVTKPRRRVDVDALRTLTDSIPDRGTSAADFIREMRDGDRY